MRYYTITTEDVGSAHIRAFDQMWPVNDFIGRIRPHDVGKRVYLRGGILQVENDEQRMARMSDGSTQQFDDDVAWLVFLDHWERRTSGPMATPNRDKRLMRIAFDWAMKYPQGSEPEADAPRCQCIPPGACSAPAVLHLFRVTGMVHETPIHDGVPTVFCEPCGDKALESGAFCAGDDMLEPNHGPGCIERMYADVDGEGGQS